MTPFVFAIFFIRFVSCGQVIPWDWEFRDIIRRTTYPAKPPTTPTTPTTTLHPEDRPFISINEDGCKYTTPTDWSACSTDCGWGTQNRVRYVFLRYLGASQIFLISTSAIIITSFYWISFKVFTDEERQLQIYREGN